MRLMRIVVLVTILLGIISASCGSSSDTPVTSNKPSNTVETTVTVKIGNLTDLTGPGANAMSTVNMALKDIAKYYNENNIVPGTKFEIVEWDGQMNPARTIPGYEWLLEKGVDVMTTCAPGVSSILEPSLETDGTVLFTQMGEIEVLDPPGNIFCLGSIPQYEAYTLLKWISENDWDYKTNGPAKIGAVAWEEPYSSGFVQAMKDYAKAHPDQFDFVGGYLTDFKFTWSSEVELLKDCDYIFPPILIHTFANNVRDVNSKAKLIGGPPHTALFPMVTNAKAWPAIDGMLFVYSGEWWTDKGEEVDFQKELLAKYHPGEADDIISRGSGYQATTGYLKMFEIIANAIEQSGAENLNSQALYNAAQTYSKSIDGRNAYSFTSTKRYMTNELAILVADAEQQTLVRNDPNWYPLLTAP